MYGNRQALSLAIVLIASSVLTLPLTAQSPANNSSAAPEVQPNVTATTKLDIVSIRLTRFGPYPQTVTHGPDPFILHVSNTSGAIDDTYSLIPQPAPNAAPTAVPTALATLHSTHSQHHDHQLVQLLPGTYELTIASHPSWTVTITVTAQ